MKLPLEVAALSLFIVVIKAQGQGTFQNLGFESASVPNLAPGQFSAVPIGQALPGWTGYLGTNSANQVIYNTISAGSAQISLIGHSSQFVSNSVIAGNYTVVLQAGNPGVQVPASIAQSGLVPAGSMSVQFGLSGVVEAFGLTFNGESIPIVPLGDFSNYKVYGGDISRFAGLAGELRFTENPIAVAPFATAYVDLISFSIQPIPEPGTVALTGVGVSILTLALRRVRRTSSTLSHCCPN